MYHVRERSWQLSINGTSTLVAACFCYNYTYAYPFLKPTPHAQTKQVQWSTMIQQDQGREGDQDPPLHPFF